MRPRGAQTAGKTAETENMGGNVSTEEHPVVQVWTEFVNEWDMEYEEKSLLDLISWTKSQGVEPTKETALDMNNLTRIGEQIIDAAFKDDQNAIKVLNPWRLILKLIKQLKANLSSDNGGLRNPSVYTKASRWQCRKRQSTWRGGNYLIYSECRLNKQPTHSRQRNSCSSLQC